MPKKILWRSHHECHPKQLAQLKKRYPEGVTITWNKKWIEGAEEVVNEFLEGGYDEVYVTASDKFIENIARVLKEKKKPGPFIMKKRQVSPENADFPDSFGFWEILPIERFKSLTIETTPI